MSAIVRSRMVASSSSSRSASVVAANRLSTLSRHFGSTMSAAASTSGSPAPVEDSVLYRSEGNTRIYKLNRTKQLNALNQEMISSLKAKLNTWKDSEQCRIVIGTGSEKAFCAGGDVKQLVLDLQEGKSSALKFFKDEFEVNWLIARLGKPYISVMDGITMGGGCGIALPAQIRIATSKSHFAMPETKIGYAPDVGVNYYLAQLDGYIGAWLAITGQDVFGRAVYELGLATHYIEPDALPLVLTEVAQLSNSNLASISSVIAASSASPATAGSVNSKSNPDGSSPIKGDIRVFLDQTFKLKSIQAIYEKLESAQNDASLSEEVKAWAKEQQKLMDLRSPTGMAVALEGYRRARQIKRLDVTLRNDIAMATGFSGSHRATDDFITGVRAVLVDRIKDRPQWSPSSVTDEAVSSDNIIAKFFESKSPSQADRPALDLNPPSSSKVTSGADSTWGQFRKLGLPSESEVEAQVSGSAPGSGAFKINKRELIERVLDVRGDAGGTRASEVEQWTSAIVDRLCTVKEDGYLDLKKDTNKDK